jgi:DNA-binding FrmR family transcriptional regulator
MIGFKKVVYIERCWIDILTQFRSVTHSLVKVQDNIFKDHLESGVRVSLSGDDLLN